MISQDDQKLNVFVMKVNGQMDRLNDPQYKGRVQHLRGPNVCSLKITDLRESDSTRYQFRFRTNNGRMFAGSPGVTLSVTGNISLKHVCMMTSASRSLCW